MKEEFIVDRIEGKYAVCEDNKKHMINIAIDKIQGKVLEGQVIVKDCDKFYIDYEKTAQLKKEIDEAASKLWSE